MRRRDFIAPVASAAASWPLPAHARQSERVRRIAVLHGTSPTGQNPASYAAFLRGLGELGRTDGRNVRIEIRWANSDPELMRSYGTELAGHSPDVFLVQSNPALAVLRPLAGHTPIVFVNVADPASSGFVASLARPAATSPAWRLRPWNGRRPLAKTIPGQISGINRRKQQGGERHD